ncbi:MAG TPA: NAD-dependent epimerase/dehydratase family protein [Polyangiaceae bacterium]|nr:NAD-dependent epimerase/dehydratase family protein [Polyangiaceae bacterium]
MTTAVTVVSGDHGPVVVTGICGRLGRDLSRLLHRQRKVIGVDRRAFIDPPGDVEHHQMDIRSSRAREVFRHGVSAVVHLGVMHDPHESSIEHHDFNVVGLQKVLEYVDTYKIPKLVLLSSANVYGPRPDNPQLIREDAPLLGAGPFSDIRDLVELDMLVSAFFWRAPSTETVILRPAHILGTVRNAPSNYLRLDVVPTLLGFDPMMQVVHQRDVLQAIERALAPGVRGIFNIGGPEPLALSKAIAILGRRGMAVPHSLAKAAVKNLFRFRLTSFPAPELDFIRYVCMVDDSKARSELSYAPRHGLEATLRAVDEERWLA